MTIPLVQFVLEQDNETTNRFIEGEINMIDQIMQWNWVLILGVAFGISEALAQIPAIKANSIFQAFFGAISWLKNKIVK